MKYILSSVFASKVVRAVLLPYLFFVSISICIVNSSPGRANRLLISDIVHVQSDVNEKMYKSAFPVFLTVMSAFSRVSWLTLPKSTLGLSIVNVVIRTLSCRKESGLLVSPLCCLRLARKNTIHATDRIKIAQRTMFCHDLFFITWTCKWTACLARRLPLPANNSRAQYNQEP